MPAAREHAPEPAAEEHRAAGAVPPATAAVGPATASSGPATTGGATAVAAAAGSPAPAPTADVAALTIDDIDPDSLPVGAHAVPEFVRLAAKASPGEWIGVIDPTWRGGTAPPRWALVGEWRADAEGEVAEFRENEEYRPSPMANGWPEPTDPVDEAVQLSATGYGPPGDVHKALSAGPMAIALDEDNAIDVVLLPDDEESPAVMVFSSDAQITAAGGPRYGVITADQLVEVLPPTHKILVNRAAVVAMRIEPEDLRAAVAEATAEAAEATEAADDPTDMAATAAANPTAAERTAAERTAAEPAASVPAEPGSPGTGDVPGERGPAVTPDSAASSTARPPLPSDTVEPASTRTAEALEAHTDAEPDGRPAQAAGAPAPADADGAGAPD
ncbi:type VII secretion system-associated protein, partial [Streptomyces sp. WAC06614]|uniref:type VII secretion system-associated protein n=1 Tax=Streptomyces sp. WAC06614 TaxID=2487416 RepID=UPI000F77D088